MGILNMDVHNPLLTTIFGILGNIVSGCVFAAPAPTFYRIYKRKSTEGFQSVPYVVALFSAMLWFYYGFIKTHVVALITINAIGCVVETLYITIYYKYSTRDSRVYLFKLIFIFNVGLFAVIILLTSSFLIKKTPQRVHILGWVCTVFSVCVFVAPLSIMKKVIRTKSVEFMPFWVSFFLMLTAVVWLFYGLLLNDIYIIIPNVVGIFLAILQMILYAIYKDNKIRGKEEEKLPEQFFNVQKPSMEVQPVIEIQVSVIHENKDEQEQVQEEAEKMNDVQMVTIEV